MPSESVKWPPNKRLVFAGEVREILRKPAGKLITGSPREVAGKIKWIIESEKPPLVVAVGDYTSRILSENDVDVNLYIIDGRIERRPVEPLRLEAENVERVVNRAGEISPEAASKLHRLLRRKRLEKTLLIVEGEEDLLTLAAILSAPDGTIIVYGQPGRGSVVVRVGESSRALAIRILRLIGYVE